MALKKIAGGMRTVTVMLPADIKDLIDRKRNECGETIAQIVQAAVIHWLSDSKNSASIVGKSEQSKRIQNFQARKCSNCALI